MTSHKNKQDGIIHILILSVLIVLFVGVGGAWVYHQQTKPPIKLAKNESKANSGDYKELEVKDVAEIEAAATTAVSDPPKQTSSSTKKSTTSPNTSTTATKTQAPTGKITISDDGCYVTAEGEPGMILEVGAVKDNKGGSMTYTMPNKGPITKATGGFKDMMAYGTLSSTDGTKIIFNSGPITVNECPPAG